MTDKELLEKARNLDNRIEADLRGANLSRANLRGANLSESDLSRANLRGANLRRADLYGADLSEVDLRGADLRGAYLRGANLIGADLSRANLSGADLSEADLRGAAIVILSDKHTMVIRPDRTKIGYEDRSNAEWLAMSDEKDLSLDSRTMSDMEFYRSMLKTCISNFEVEADG